MASNDKNYIVNPFNLVLMNNDTDVTALVTLSHKRKEIVVTYRGSQNVWNYVLDFTPLNVCYNGPECDIKIHIGFYIFTMSLYNEVNFSFKIPVIQVMQKCISYR